MDEMVSQYGCVLSPEDERDYQAQDYISMGMRAEVYVPQEYAPVLNQGNVGSCVAHALATLKWYQERKERGYDKKWSTDYIYHNRLEGDWQGDGMIIRQALSQLKKCGVCGYDRLPSNSVYPNSAIKPIVGALTEDAQGQQSGDYVRCNNVDELCAAIYQNNGAIIAIDVRTSFHGFYLRNESNWVLPLPKDEERSFGNHCLCAVGYNADGIIIQNSWGSAWGKGGFAILPYDYPIAEMWSVMDVKSGVNVVLNIDSKKALVNGSEVVLDVAATVIDGRTMVPVRFVSEALGCEVVYDEGKRQVVISRE